MISFGGSVWARRAARHRSIRRASFFAGMTTVTSGECGAASPWRGNPSSKITGKHPSRRDRESSSHPTISADDRVQNQTREREQHSTNEEEDGEQRQSER